MRSKDNNIGTALSVIAGLEKELADTKAQLANITGIERVLRISFEVDQKAFWRLKNEYAELRNKFDTLSGRVVSLEDKCVAKNETIDTMRKRNGKLADELQVKMGAVGYWADLWADEARRSRALEEQLAEASRWMPAKVDEGENVARKVAVVGNEIVDL